MKKSICASIAAFIALISISTTASAANLAAGLKAGNPELKSVGPIAFGPDGVLFVSDPASAAIVAIATGDTDHGSHAAVKITDINKKIAAKLGTTADQVRINDLAVNPASHTPFLSVTRGNGANATPVLLKVSHGHLSVVSLKNVKFSRATLPNPPADRTTGEGRRRRNPRLESITDIAFQDGNLIVAGLSNEEFASSLRTIPFPFKKVGKGSSIEIYHGAHGKFETRSPIRTFIPVQIDGDPHLLAAYTCTPLVKVPVSDLKPGVHVKGTTIAELGNRNRPLDMISYRKNGKDYILMANSARGIMKIATSSLGAAQGIVDRVSGKAGVGYETIESWKGISQLDKLDSQTALVLQATEGNSANLVSIPLP